MRIGIGATLSSPEDANFVIDAERIGASTVWVPEVWGYDAFTPLAYLTARTSTIRLATGIVQLGARTPAMLAMSAMSMQALSGGRFVLGVGTSGPQVMEGWHGVRFAKPVQTTRETIDIIRTVSRGDRLAYDGEVYTLPRPDGPGRAIRSMAPPVHIPIYVAALGPRNLAVTGELADGWLGNAFMPETAEPFMAELRAGAAAGGRTLADLDLVIPVGVEITADEDAAATAARRHADGYAFTIGAMGSKSKNFYNEAFSRQGFADDISAVQQLWLDGHRDRAAARVPIEIGARTNILGTPAMVKERLRLYRAAGITSLQAKLGGSTTERLDTLAQLVDLVREVDAEPVG